MAARSQSHVDVGVNERRLRPIYDCLDNSNNKKALQEAEKLLKKQKDFPCAKVLKSLALIRLGKQIEATSVLKEVHDEVPVDDSTLQAMTICYRELHKPELIADAYEAAVKKEPQNEEFMTHLFMSYVRLGDYKKQQQVAMSLYRLKPKNPYYFWAVMSILMQAHTADEKLAKTMLLPLAQRMTEKFINDNKIEAEAEVQLYLMILELQGKLDEALNVLNGPLGDRLASYVHYNAQRRATLLTQLERWPEANSSYRDLLTEYPDQWVFYLEYFRTGFILHDLHWHPEKDCEKPGCDFTPTMIADFVLSLVQNEDSKTSKYIRGPYLARLELFRQLIERQDPVAQSLGSFRELILCYYKKFGDRGCFFEDVKMFLEVLNEEDGSYVLDKVFYIITCENNGIISEAKNEKELQRHVNYLQLCEFLGRHNQLNTAQKIEIANDVIQRYNSYLQLESDLLPTDHHPVDLYCIMAGHILIQLWKQTGDSTLIWQPIVLLEKGLRISPNNHQIKLLLIKLYNCLGAIETSYALYESLDVKHIQQDTLGYLVTRHLAAKGHYSQACNVFSNTLKFFMANHKDTVDYLISSYKFGSFTKIHEFVKFRERLNNSLQYALTIVERMILDIILDSNCHNFTERNIAFLDIDPENDNLEKYANLRDNRDLSLMVTWERNEKNAMEEAISNSLLHEIEWLKLRNLLVRSLATAYLVTRSNSQETKRQTSNSEVTNGDRKNAADILQDLLVQLRETSDRIKTIAKTPSSRLLQMPEPSRLDFYADGIYLDVIIYLQEIVLYLNSLIERGISEKEDIILEEAMHSKIADLLQEAVNHVTSESVSQNLTTDFTKWQLLLENFGNLAETLSFAAILSGFCQRILKPAKNALQRKGKKKKEISSIQMPQTFSNFNTMLIGLEKAASSLLSCIQELSNSVSLSDVQRISLNDEILSSEGKETFVFEIQKKVGKSYLQSLKEIEELVKHKVKYFTSLRL